MKKVPLILLLALFTSTCMAQVPSFSREVYVNHSDTLRYRQLTPKFAKDQSYPLVIFLHGAGERGEDNEAQLKWGVMQFAQPVNWAKHPAIVIVPQCPKGQSWASVSRGKEVTDMKLQSEPSPMMQLIRELIDKALQDYPVDASRIYITGLSMGGFGTYDALERYPNLFAAAVPVCGGGDVSLAATISGIPIWIFHGANDPVVSPIYSLEMLKALTAAGGHPGFTQFPDTEHNSWIAAYREPGLMDWLFSKHR